MQQRQRPRYEHRPKKKAKNRGRRRKDEKDLLQSMTIRLPKDVFGRLDRLLEWVQPRMRVMSGKEAGRSDIVRAVIISGIEQTEKRFGLTEEPSGFVLVDEGFED